MSDYKHILVGLDLTPDESTTVFDKAMKLAGLYNAKISVAHVIEPLVFAYAGEVPIDFTNTQQAIEARATENLHAFASRQGVSISDTHVLLGPTAVELKEFAHDTTWIYWWLAAMDGMASPYYSVRPHQM